mmetsp:Transcript_28593/g.46917  ORF Transcript_28593/g.46917 Transcript_28593/m.46917 type:complete len:276 (-) Transcript_28593:185-1012(-)
MEVFAASLAYNARVRFILRNIAANRVPNVAKHGSGAGKIDSGQIGMFQCVFAHQFAWRRNEVDHARRQPSLLQYLIRHVIRQHRRGRRLPQPNIAQQRRRRTQIAANRGKIERRDGETETFERSKLDAVPDAVVVQQRILWRAVHLFHKLRSKPPEIDELGGGINLGLPHRLALSEHGGRVQLVAVHLGQQPRRLGKDGQAILDRQRLKLLLALHGALNRFLQHLRRGLMIRADRLRLVVWHKLLASLTRAYLFAIDNAWNVGARGVGFRKRCFQ